MRLCQTTVWRTSAVPRPTQIVGLGHGIATRAFGCARRTPSAPTDQAALTGREVADMAEGVRRAPLNVPSSRGHSHD